MDNIELIESLQFYNEVSPGLLAKRAGVVIKKRSRIATKAAKRANQFGTKELSDEAKEAIQREYDAKTLYKKGKKFINRKKVYSDGRHLYNKAVDNKFGKYVAPATVYNTSGKKLGLTKFSMK